jgi:hypothetical protein
VHDLRSATDQSKLAGSSFASLKMTRSERYTARFTLSLLFMNLRSRPGGSTLAAVSYTLRGVFVLGCSLSDPIGRLTESALAGPLQ